MTLIQKICEYFEYRTSHASHFLNFQRGGPLRAGHFVKQLTGYTAFIPKALPPEPTIEYDEELVQLLTSAERALGKLDGISSVLPNQDLFVSMYVKKEAVLSSQIEGTQSSLNDILEYEVDKSPDKHPKDIGEVVNYVKAMNYGLQRVKEFPLSQRLIKEIHAVLMNKGRGSEKEPGEFRRSQNWIGPSGCTLNQAMFVPPPVDEMKEAISDLEKFLHAENEIPILIVCGLVHAQFETIHPFLDGNGRVGRLLITFLLCQKGILQRPLLYLSHYLKLNRQEYYDRLMDVRRKGKWEEWLKFFLRGVHSVSKEASEKARKIVAMREKHRQLISSNLKNLSSGLKFHDYLFDHPVCNSQMVQDYLKTTYYVANKLLDQFVDLGLLKTTTKRKRNKHYFYKEYCELFEDEPHYS